MPWPLDYGTMTVIGTHFAAGQIFFKLFNSSEFETLLQIISISAAKQRYPSVRVRLFPLYDNLTVRH
jgi:hypothetical protein